LTTTELTVICRGQPRNLTKCHAEFTEFFRAKLGSLVTCLRCKMGWECPTLSRSDPGPDPTGRTAWPNWPGDRLAKPP